MGTNCNTLGKQAVKDNLSLSKAIIHELHQYFDEEGIDNFDHIMTVKKVIRATCNYFPSKARQIESELYAYAFDLFWQLWKFSLEEDEEEYDIDEEKEEAKRIFSEIYEKEEDVW